MNTQSINQNTLTIEIEMVAGQTKYTIGNIKRLPGRVVESIMLVSPSNTGGPSLSVNGKTMASYSAPLNSYLSLYKEDGQTLALDQLPLGSLVYDIVRKVPFLLKPQAFDFDKSFITMDTTVVEPGNVISLVVNYRDECN